LPLRAKHLRLIGKAIFVKEEFMNIRIAQKEDAPALVEFNQAMALETEGKRLDSQVLKSGVEAVFHDEKKGFYVVAEEDDEIVGGLLITFEWSDWRDGWFWWVQSVYVLPNARGRGVYPSLYEFVKEKAREVNNVCGFRLYVEKENTRAQKVYEKLGMERSQYLPYEEII
jgi:ribosomal protein S18 acetylase RimI-like enzyme